MEACQDLQQYGTCVDPLWDPFSTDHVKALVRKESPPNSDSNVSKTSTPLTPQEFELLSDSNPFKQDIAEKYGLAYPGITTKSQSIDFLNKAKSLLDLDDLFKVRFRRRSTNDESCPESSSGGSRARRHYRESSTRAVSGLNEFLLKNQQSIEESIQKLGDSNEELSLVKRQEFLLQNQKSIEKSIQRLESLERERHLSRKLRKQKSSAEEVLDSNIPDIGPQDEPNNNTHFNKDILFKDNLINLDDKVSSDTPSPSIGKQDNCDKPTSSPTNVIEQISSDLQSTPESLHLDDPERSQKRHDPYAAILHEDICRKREHAKSLSDAQSFGSKDESFDIPRLLTKSIDIGELPRLAKDIKTSQFDISPNDEQLEKVKKLQKGLKHLYSTSIETVSNTSPVDVGQDNQIEVNISPSITGESIDYHFGSSLDSSEEISKSLESIVSPLTFVPCSSDANKVVHIQSSDSDSQGLVSGPSSSNQIIIKSSSFVNSPDVDSNDDVFAERTPETTEDHAVKVDEWKTISPLSSDHDVNFDRSVSPSPEIKEAPMASDQFSSSFYTMFGTTVTSLEDIANSGQDQCAGKEKSPDYKQKLETEDLVEADTDEAKWDGSEDLGALDDSASHFDETSGDDSVFGETRSQNCQDELISFVDSIHSLDRGDHSPCISKDILFQTKVSLSSGDSSRGSISRESMRVNLSQDSSTLEHSEDTPLSSTLISQSDQPLRKPFDIASLVPLNECKSMDSMLVNTSSDSLAAQGVSRGSDQFSKPPDRANRGSLSIDLRRRNMQEQTRRRSLPMVRLKNLGKATPLLWTSQSVDVNIESAHRRSSLPMDEPITKEIKTYKSSQTKLQYEDPSLSSMSSFTSFGKKSSFPDKDKCDTPVSKDKEIEPLEKTADMQKADSILQDIWGVPIVKISTTEPNTSTSSPWSTDSWGLVKQFSDDFILDHLTPSQQEKDTSAEFGKVNYKNDTEELKEITNLLVDTSTENIDTHSSEVLTHVNLSDQSLSFSEFVKTKVQKPLRVVLPFSQHHDVIESNDPPQTFGKDVDLDEAITAAKLVDVIEQEMDGSKDADNGLPPDLLLNKTSLATPTSPKATPTSPISIPELNQVELNSTYANIDVTHSQVETENSVENANVEEFSRDDRFRPNDVTDKPDSSSDSDGGDIDALVQEYKQEVVDSDDGDIDDIVKEFKDVQPEVDAHRTAEDSEKLRKSAFNKFGKVLNKMQSVTKYMTTKKKDKDGEDKLKSPPLSGRHTRSQSEDEGGEGSDGRRENEDAFELLNKAAEVFKAQTVKKKRKSTVGTWRSKTEYSETLEPDTETDYDLVTRAAILFKGFKTKKPKEIEGVGSNSETEPIRLKHVDANQSIELVAHDEERKCDDVVKGDDVEKGGDVVKGDDVVTVDDVEISERCNDGISRATETDKLANSTEPLLDSSSSNVNEPDHCDKEKSLDSELSERVNSAMIDSGFESVIKFASEQQETTEEVALFDSDHVVTAHESSVEIAGQMAIEHSTIDHDVRLESGLADKVQGPNVLEENEKSFLPDDNLTHRVESMKEEERKEGKMDVVGIPSEKISLDSYENVKPKMEGVQKQVIDKNAKIEEFSERSLTVDSELEPESPKILGVLNEQTCDLILSTGYDDRISTRSDGKINFLKQELKTSQTSTLNEANVKLEQIAKEISNVDAEGLKFTNAKSGTGNLDLKPPEYKRLSSESTENQDSCSMTVNCPDSPENGMSVNGDGGFSLCCGTNIKLNCTAMVKKPERRPSAVVIANKRCAMTEEENMFPMKVSESFRQGLNQDHDKPDSKITRPQAQVRVVHDLKVNEHELNRNFAGSREELLNDPENKNMAPKTSQIVQEEKDSPKDPTPLSQGVITSDFERDRQTRLEKRRSIIENPDADKRAINMYDSVLDELVEIQTSKAEMGENQIGQEARETSKSKRYGRVMSESDFEANFGQAIEKCEQKLQQIAKHEMDTGVVTEGVVTDPTQYVRDHLVTIKSRDNVPGFIMQQSIDVYDNLLYPDSAQSTLDRSYRYRPQQRDRRGLRDVVDTRSSFTSVVSDGVSDEYIHGRRSHGRSKWVSSTPHLCTVEKQTDMVNSRTNSLPYLDRPDTIPRHYRSDVAASAISFNSYSAGWGNYARIDDVNDRRSYDSESSTSGLVIPGAGRESTLSDVSDAYIFGEYSTVKDEIPYDRVIRPMDGHRIMDNSFRFRHVQTTSEDSPYENMKVITSQPIGSRTVYVRSDIDIRGDLTDGYQPYAIIANPMESKYVQYSDPTSPAGVIKISCASQTSTESLVGLVRDDASDILEGLPVFEYTLGATQSTESHLADAANSPGGYKFADDKPDLTRQTQSLDRRTMKQSEGPRNSYVIKKATKVTFSRDAVLTDVIDGIKKSEQGQEASGRGIRNIATSTMSSIGGGVKEIARIFHVPFQCCRSSRKEKPRSK
ncbi:microtubule-associated protein futsch isoform X2, partial [Biomphalaria pfeifferi]